MKTLRPIFVRLDGTSYTLEQYWAEVGRREALRNQVQTDVVQLEQDIVRESAKQ